MKTTVSKLLFYIFMVLIIICLAYILYLKKKRSFFKDVNSPFHLPLIGASYLFFSKNYLKPLLALLNKYGLPLHALLGPYSFYLTSDPSEVKIILNHPECMNKMKFFRFLEPLFGESLLIAPVHQWKKNRKILSKAFNQSVLENFIPDCYQKSCILLKMLKDNKDVNIFDCLQKYTLDSFAKTAMGVELNIQSNKNSLFVDTITKLQDLAAKRFFQPWSYNDFIYFKTPQGKETLKMVQILKDYVLKIIRSKRESYLKNRKDNFEETKLKAIMDLLLEMEAEGLLTETQVLNEMNLMISAATDTSAAALAFICTLLGMHPEIQERVYQEVLETIGLTGSITHEDLSKLKYTERVINEGMRLLPPTPVFGRVTDADVDIGTRVIPKNTNVIIVIYHLHRNPEIYKDPLKFDPDRFLPEEISKRPPYSFLPFSGGPRNCIGLRYAYMIMKTAIANIVRNLEISSDYKSVDEISLISNIVMTCESPLKCYFTPRKHM